MKNSDYYIWKDGEKVSDFKVQSVQTDDPYYITTQQSDLSAERQTNELEFFRNIRLLEKHEHYFIKMVFSTVISLLCIAGNYFTFPSYFWGTACLISGIVTSYFIYQFHFKAIPLSLEELKFMRQVSLSSISSDEDDAELISEYIAKYKN